ncbi:MULTISPECIES: hypothetical protein [Glutamicibacter]|uniref:Uncharacterized protein n=2 Tax=Glutamicibacter arilaitensis TaxID=256701 RepID=A0A2N7RY71_9MICC|nr:hypothetical protein [Glutamicibacter arilaitensis]PMQ18842.1 hypothetical protein CIK84_15760 [Glutamicibacter arilaitensis]CBT77150.1 hypothetical membrane protein [Glutamicibacter arilaitensis Re117]HCM95581.1 hypothetical protein [Glutamicibacter sp.]
MATEANPTSQNKRKPKAILSDYFYLVLALLGLSQLPATFQTNGLWIGLLQLGAILCFTYLIAAGNKGRFVPWLDHDKHRI